MKKHIVDVRKLSEVLNIWRYIYPIPEAKEDDCVWIDTPEEYETYNFVLSSEKKEELDRESFPEIAMSLFLSTDNPNFLSISTNLPNNRGSSLIVFREITNVIYLKEYEKVIFESNKNDYISVMELERIYPGIRATVNINLTKEEYEKTFKNY